MIFIDESLEEYRGVTLPGSREAKFIRAIQMKTFTNLSGLPHGSKVAIIPDSNYISVSTFAQKPDLRPRQNCLGAENSTVGKQSFSVVSDTSVVEFDVDLQKANPEARKRNPTLPSQVQFDIFLYSHSDSEAGSKSRPLNKSLDCCTAEKESSDESSRPIDTNIRLSEVLLHNPAYMNYILSKKKVATQLGKGLPCSKEQRTRK